MLVFKYMEGVIIFAIVTGVVGVIFFCVQTITTIRAICNSNTSQEDRPILGP